MNKKTNSKVVNYEGKTAMSCAAPATPDESGSSSVSSQGKLIRLCCEIQNLKPDDIFADCVSNTNLDRPGLDKISAICQKNKVDCLAVTNLARMLKNAAIYCALKSAVRELGIKIPTTREPFQVNSPDSELSEATLAAMNVLHIKSSQQHKEKTNEIREIDGLNDQ